MLSSALSLRDESENAGFSPNEQALIGAGLIFSRLIKTHMDVQTAPDLIRLDHSYPRLYLTVPPNKVDDIVDFLRKEEIAAPGWSGLTLSECVNSHEIGEQTVVTITACTSLVQQYADLLDAKLAPAATSAPAAALPALRAV
jgi:hypothetical protein